MKAEELIGHLKDIDAHLNVLRGRQIANTMALEYLLAHSPGALAGLRSINLEGADWLMQGRQVTDECILHTLDQLRLLRALGETSS